MSYTIYLNNDYLLQSKDVEKVRAYVRSIRNKESRLSIYKNGVRIGSKLSNKQASLVLLLAENVELVEDGAMVNLQLAMGRGGV